MKAVLNFLTDLALKFRSVTLIAALIISLLGGVASTQLKQELIPPIEIPQTYILAQVSGMTSEQALNVMTTRIESALNTIPEIINIESTTTGAIGAFITASNDFGLNQQRLKAQIQDAINTVWLPQRQIQVPEGASVSSFIADLTPDILIYLQQRDANFLFQISPEIWAALSDETARTLLGYLAAQTAEAQENKSALEQLIEQSLIPQIKTVDTVANVAISGGQILPGENSPTLTQVSASSEESASLLLQLSPQVWQIAAPKAGYSGTLDSSAVEALRAIEFTIPETAPKLPTSWQQDRFETALDLLEVRTLTQSTGDVINNFLSTKRIVGALGQTNDLTPETITRMLEIEPSLVNAFEAQHLVAMSPEVFAALPDDYIANLDGFTRDALAAASLAESITGETVEISPVNLPSAWRISPPSLITFSFADLPLATFSVFSTDTQESHAIVSNENIQGTETATETANETVSQAAPNTQIPEGPALPPIFLLLGTQFGIELNTADDLLNIQLPPEAAEQLGGATTLKAADLFNFLMLLSDPSALPPGTPGLPVNINPKGIIGSFSPEAVAFIAQYDSEFLPSLSSDVFDAFSDSVLALDEIAPRLDNVWNTLSQQPQFRNRPLRTAADIIALGNGKASTVLNAVSDTVPARFKGYDVRLFNSLSTGLVRYFTLHEPDFYANLSPTVLEALSPEVLSLLPESFLNSIDSILAEKLTAIASGEQLSAADELAALYASNFVPADPSAPALNPEWQVIANFIPGIELNNAYDFFRFPDKTGTPAQFINGFFDSPQGANFAPGLLGGLSVDAFNFVAQRDANFVNDLRVEALLLLPDTIASALPSDVVERARSAGEPFKPTNQVTRTNRSSSLLVTIYKTRDANTVQTFHDVEKILSKIDEEDPTINIQVAFEQASFIEESISGVAREGGLGAVFAVVVILVFLSGGLWSRSPRRLVGIIMMITFAVLLVGAVSLNLSAANGDFGLAFSQTDVVIRVLLILGVAAGLSVAFWPGNLPYPAWRSTLVTAVSIPLSVLMALALMHWVSPFMHRLLAPSAESSSLMLFFLRLFPENITFNIMTLSGLTVAIGRVVDDSIVVLENIFRQIQAGGDKRQAILTGTRDVSVAIFAATAVTIVVFLPLGLTGGIIGEFFLPFGLAVSYALGSSFVVAITVIPVLVYLLVRIEDVPPEHDSRLAKVYQATLRWALNTGKEARLFPFIGNRTVVLVVAFLSMFIGFGLFGARPTTFLPELGEPEVTVDVSLPASTKILTTNEKVEALEAFVETSFPGTSIRTVVGGGGLNFEALIGGGGSVSENRAQVTLRLGEQQSLEEVTTKVREQAESIFGEEHVVVSAQSASSGGFGGFAIVLSGKQEDLTAVDAKIIETLANIDGLTNVTSNLSQFGSGGSDSDAPITYLRVNSNPAVSYSAELETENTLGVTQQAIEAIKMLPDLPESISVSQGFQSELQTQGFASLFVAMGIAIILVIIILMFTFNSLVHWLDIILSIIVAPVGAAVALTLTNRVLGISAMIGMLMLIGIVVTNAVVLIDRVQSNRRERGMDVFDALIEAGGRRLRPILMTALATIMALLPLAIGLSKGAIIASELGTVVIGGLFSSTLLTLIVVPVAYSFLAPVHKSVVRLFGRGSK